MGLSIKIADASFTNVVASLSLPDRTGLVGEFTFGENSTKSVVNRATPSSPPMTLVGTPTYGANYAEIRSGGGFGSIGFNTGLPIVGDFTLIAVVKKVSGFPSFMATPGAGFLNYLSAPLLYNTQSGTSTSVANVAVPAHTDFTFFAGRMPLGGKGEIHTFTGGVLTTNEAEVAGSITRIVDNMTIGTTVSNGGQGIAQIAYSAAFSRDLDDEEILDAYTSLKTYLETRDVVVS